MKTLKVQWFALLREKVGRAETEWQTEASTVDELYRELQEAFALPLPPEDVRLALNDGFVSKNHPVSHGDRLAVIPPVAGG